MKQNSDRLPRCAECAIKNPICRNEDGNAPDGCTTLEFQCEIDAARSDYGARDTQAFALNATIQSAQCYANQGKEGEHPRFAMKPRVQETIEFAHKMGYRRLGLAFCGGLHNEARILARILKAQGFELASVMCKAGGVPKEFLGIKKSQKVSPEAFETMCNPIAQARILNAAETEFNILFGLCVGHDSLVLRHSEALCTVLVVKDRVTGHNPLAAINLHRSYYKRLEGEEFGEGRALEVVRLEPRE